MNKLQAFLIENLDRLQAVEPDEQASIDGGMAVLGMQFPPHFPPPFNPNPMPTFPVPEPTGPIAMTMR